jgi:hypothetical protein
MPTLAAQWPDDADGDVFRRLAAHSFDFSRPYAVDYNVDFKCWPPARAALDLLDARHGPIRVFEPGEHGDGYVQFQLHGPLTYEGVISVQRAVSVAMAPFGGVCESWGVMQDAP